MISERYVNVYGLEYLVALYTYSSFKSLLSKLSDVVSYRRNYCWSCVQHQ